MKILVTGSAGFIGYHLSKRLLEAGNQVVGIDSINGSMRLYHLSSAGLSFIYSYTYNENLKK